MAMASIGEALSVASGFLGLGGRYRGDAAPEATDVLREADGRPHLDALAPGEPCFEAVAQALAEAGYLDS